ncbi:MAG: efflux transporter outer membrane subunit [Alphaproteobacteria bacterium]|nr:efflux transporter outer membrane subunit [Alphaproteobacteria bacterium]MCL2505889.1 efflux transporter outer membrane subunit [Alphaproteobacteria bacterium]
MKQTDITLCGTLRLSSLVVLTALLTGCMVGPDFKNPAAPDVSSYTVAPTPRQTADGMQMLVHGQDVPSNWWFLFKSRKLNDLIDQAVQHNPNIASAQAALRAAEAGLYAGEAGLIPSLTGAFSSARSGSSEGVYNLHRASVKVSYDLDLWGGTRRNIEQLQAKVDMARFELEAAKLSLISNVITFVVSEASLREQIDMLKANINAQTQIVELFKIQFEAGAISRVELAAQEGILAGLKSTLPNLENNLSATRNALTALVGQLPEKQIAAMFKLSDMTLPVNLPLSVPSKLVAQRPDIRAVEENLHAYSAAIGIAVAARLPNISLSGNMGSSAGAFTKLFSSGTGFWGIGADVAGVIFDAGALAQKEQIAREQFEMAVAKYNQTVISAFQDVADTLYALDADARALVSQKDSLEASKTSLDLANVQFEAGATSRIELLQAQRGYFSSRSSYAQAAAMRFADTAALFAALGGGWWNSELVDDSEFPEPSVLREEAAYKAEASKQAVAANTKKTDNKTAKKSTNKKKTK